MTVCDLPVKLRGHRPEKNDQRRFALWLISTIVAFILAIVIIIASWFVPRLAKYYFVLKITGLDKVSESNMKWYYDDLDQYNTDEYYSNFNEAE